MKGMRLNWPYLLSATLSPMSLLFVVGVLSSGKGLPFALAGGLISMVTIMSIGEAGGMAWFRFDIKYIDLIITTATSQIDFMLGEIAGTVIWAIPGLLIYLAMDLYFNLLSPLALIVTLFVIGLIFISVTSIAFWLSGVVKYSRHVWAFVGLLSLVMTILPPTFYSYTFLPKPALYALLIIPSTSAAIVEQGVFGISPMNWWALVVLIIETVAYFMVARHLTKWRDN